MDELIQAMSITELQTFKETYKGNQSVATIIDGYIEVKVRQEAQVKAREDFGKAISKLADKLPHPEDVHNVYLAWREVEVEDTSQPAEVVVIDGVEESRYPKAKATKWVVELNKGFQVARGASGNTSGNGTSKRAITVYKRNGTANVLVGNFPNYASACRHVKLACAGSLGGTDSGERVLTKNGYVYDPYTGTDYLA